MEQQGSILVQTRKTLEIARMSIRVPTHAPVNPKSTKIHSQATQQTPIVISEDRVRVKESLTAISRRKTRT